jgi:predicted kinase
MAKELVLVRGVSGAGKTTFALDLLGEKCELVSADMFFIDEYGDYKFDGTKLKQAHQWCKSRVEELMDAKESVAVANTFTREWEMQDYYDLAAKYGYRVFSIIVENRHNGTNLHDVSEEHVQKMRDRFEIKL